jgi:signal transduction histidine kinase
MESVAASAARGDRERATTNRRRLAERRGAGYRHAERMVEWQEHERRRMAGEIHDGISQRIVSLFFHLSAAADAIPGSPGVAAEQVARAQELAGAALDETRSAIAGLRPPVLDDLGLAARPPRAWATGSLPDEEGSTRPRLSRRPSMPRPPCTDRPGGNAERGHTPTPGRSVRLYREQDRHAVLVTTDDGTGFDCRGPGRPGGPNEICLRC